MNTNLSIKQLDDLINQNDSLLIAIGSEIYQTNKQVDFENNFSDFIKEFNFIDFKQASVYPFLDISNYWAFFSRYIKLNYFDKKLDKTFIDLKNYLENKNYFIITTNSDNSLEQAGFDLDKIFYLDAKYNLLECSNKCTDQLYTNDLAILNMANNQNNLKVSLDLIPRCSKCNSFLKVHQRYLCRTFIQDDQFISSENKYQNFINQNKDKKMLFWEIGVNFNNQLTVKQPFWKMVSQFSNATYLAMNQKVYRIPLEIRSKSITYTNDLHLAIKNLLEVKNGTYRTN
ncbi:deacetylase SIR2 [Mycoplasma feriruminatoris]|uniref:Protein ADP-ribosyltransferase n=1 Tax=Mycoplasma feriruminatoris TaxID=1179777 RepID=A0AAX3TFC6_9MOLU|nr:deacetylase SIR2 [Mycoplasma feriruminatoris]WFQ92613.1 Protein ADP-ribosyltransferase [Mycoplasma feriruminatoris]